MRVGSRQTVVEAGRLGFLLVINRLYHYIGVDDWSNGSDRNV